MATSVTLKPNAIDISGSTSGTTTLQASAVAGTTTLTLPAATDTLVGKATTDTLTNKTLTGAAMNGTLGATTPSTASVTTLTTSSTVTHSGGTANGVAYLDGSKVLTTGSALVFDGSNLGLGVTPSANAGVSTLSIANYNKTFSALTFGSNANSAGYVGYNMGNTSTSNTWKYISADTGSALYFAGNEFRFMQFASGSAGATTSGTQAMTLDASGNLMIGGTGYTNKRVSSIVPASWTGSAFYGEAQTSFTGGVYFSVTATAAGTGWYHMVCQSSGGTNNLLIFGNGNVQNANNSYGAISDAKLKENIVDATPKLEKLMQVRIRNYNLKGEYEQHKQIGVVAQELEQVFPSMVEESPDKDADGNDLGTVTKSVKYSVFVPMLIKAMQELKAEFDAYKASHQ